jgi:molybdopterin-containing oxidoreductase family iron-sulfur binding subunit
LLTQSVSSPTLGAQIRGLQQKFPQMKWHTWEPVNRDGARGGARMAFGQPVETRYLQENADVVVALDADFLMGGFPGFVRLAREWARRRNPDAPMNRTYAIESCPTVTGFKADHRLPVRASEIEQYARGLASTLGMGGVGGNIRGEHKPWLDALAKDLQAHRGRAVIIPGEHQPPVVHALAHLMNEALGAPGKTVVYTESVVENPVDNVASIRELVQDMNAGRVQMLLVLDGNPVFDAPVDLNFSDAMSKVPLRIHYGLYQNETTVYSHWHVAATHFLEEWGDLRAANGMVTLTQPLIAPLYGGHSAHEVVAVFGGQPDTSGYELIRAFWRSQQKGADFDGWWRRSVHDGYIADSDFKPRPMEASDSASKALQQVPAFDSTLHPKDEVEVIYRPDPSIYDGRFANNAWLQELPKPLASR